MTRSAAYDAGREGELREGLAMPKSGWVAVATVLVLGAGVGESAAQGQGKQPRPLNLFSRAPVGTSGNDVLGMAPETVGAVSYVSLSIDTDSLVRGRTAGSAPRRMQIALPGGKSVTCMLRSEEGPDGLTVLSGATVGDAGGGHCDLVVENGQVTGAIDSEAARYRIQPIGAGAMHAVVEVRAEALPDEEQPARDPDDDDQRSGRNPVDEAQPCDVKPKPGAAPKSFGPLRLMFVYTPAASKGTRHMRADIELIMTQIRRLYSESLLGGNFSVSVELAYAGEVNYTEPADGDMRKDLDRLTDPKDPIFKEVHALRDKYRAHIVHMLIKNRPTDGCGTGWYNVRLRADRAFSVSDRECALVQFSAAHEIGHNLAMNHDRYAEPKGKPGPEEFNFGFVNLKDGVRSLMAYQDECKDQKKACRRILRLSSPKIDVSGAPFGQSISNSKAAYNAEVLCRSAPIAAKFR